MIADQSLAQLLRHILKGEVTTVEPIGVPYSSNRVYEVTTAVGQRYVVKQPKQIRETISPFWQQMDAIFGINSVTQLATVREVSERLQRQALIPVPQVIHVEAAASEVDAPFVVVTHLAGAAHEPDEFPSSEALHEQLGQYVGYLHTQPYAGYGNVLMEPLHPQADFLTTMAAMIRQTISRFWTDQAELHRYLDELTTTVEAEALFSSANLIMIDISGNQFVYDNQRISGVVDLDTYVIGPREWELSILEMCITEPAAFRRGYECHVSLPTFAPFRAFYRLWSYLNEPGDGYDEGRFTQFMQQAIYFA
jgi:aminoglycoside phosphotransferase (APT) family kinase protein